MTSLPFLIKLLFDSVAYYSAVSLSMFFYEFEGTGVPHVLGQVNPVLIIGGHVLFILSVYNYGGYKSIREFSSLSEVTALLRGATFMLVVSITALFLFRIPVPEFITTEARFGFGLALFVFPPVVRAVANKLLRSLGRNEKRERALVYGAGEMGNKFIEVLLNSSNPRFEIVGVIDDSPDTVEDPHGIPILGSYDDIDEIAKQNSIDRLIVAFRHVSQEMIQRLVSKVNQLGIRISFLPSIESFAINPLKLKDYSGITMVSAAPKAQPFFYKFTKRVVDIVMSVAGLIVTSPFLLIIPVLIKRGSPGPAIFKHERVGLNGKNFTIYKYRTMYVDTPQYAHCPASADDPRITPVGKWLRSYSIDEIPQLFNIFKGDMSIVGPRPEMPFIVEKYSELEKRRLSVKPGLTGLWQISSARNAEISHNLEYDFYYVEHQGLILDFVIMILTAVFVFRGVTH